MQGQPSTHVDPYESMHPHKAGTTHSRQEQFGTSSFTRSTLSHSHNEPQVHNFEASKYGGSFRKRGSQSQEEIFDITSTDRFQSQQEPTTIASPFRGLSEAHGQEKEETELAYDSITHKNFFKINMPHS